MISTENNNNQRMEKQKGAKRVKSKKLSRVQYSIHGHMDSSKNKILQPSIDKKELQQSTDIDTTISGKEIMPISKHNIREPRASKLRAIEAMRKEIALREDNQKRRKQR